MPSNKRQTHFEIMINRIRHVSQAFNFSISRIILSLNYGSICIHSKSDTRHVLTYQINNNSKYLLLFLILLIIVDKHIVWMKEENVDEYNMNSLGL